MTEDSVQSHGFPACLVCGDKSSGLHYGIYSCEGCKCFFRRSANGANVRPCKHEGLCEISIKTRGKCQGCRYAKCIGVGMIPDESPTKRRRSYSTPKVKIEKDKDLPEPIPCEVCGDDAYTMAYGIHCCSGCKSFFRRSIDNGGVYTCREDEFCDITIKSRMRCKKCRYARCLAVGMDTNAVRRYDIEANTSNLQVNDSECDDNQDMNLEPETAPQPTENKDCVICGDTAIGKHHGVLCCMECKCFFARSIVKNLKYECLEDPDACGLLLNVKCKRCRLQKCLDMGMTQAARRLKKTSKSGMRLRPQGDDSDFSDLGFDSDDEDSDLFTYLKLSKTENEGEKKSDEDEGTEKPAEVESVLKQNGAFSPEKDEPITDKKCEVCGDAAVGRSYNVMSCSACANFFRVTSKAEEDLECVCDEINDDITMEIRRKCPYCRYQKCLSAGMKRITLSKRLSRSPMKTNQNNEDNITEGADGTNKSPGRIRIKMFNFNKLKKSKSRKSPATEDHVGSGDEGGDISDDTPLSAIKKKNRLYKVEGKPNVCAVCGEPADGYHYGAFCCMGCNCFFKRTVQKGLEYECVNDQLACSLSTPGRAAKCKHCRFQKCLSIGMKNVGKFKAARARAKEMRNEAIAAAKTGRPKGNPEPSSADISQTDVSMEDRTKDAEDGEDDKDVAMDAEVAAAMETPAGPLCAVCGDEASGMRGAIHCCVDCRSFFYLVNSDSISSIPDCPKEPKCDVDTDIKSACTYCRYQKCLAVGMDKGVSPIKESVETKASKRSNGDKDSPEVPKKKKSKLSGNKSTDTTNPVKSESDGSSTTSDTVTTQNKTRTEACTARKSALHGTPPSSPWKGVRCVVCDDKSYTKAYTVDCCSSCKSFFRRALTKHKDYVCRGLTKVDNVEQKGSCPVTVNNRRCQYCRFKMCVKKGMKSSELNDAVPVAAESPKTVNILSKSEQIKRKWLLQDMGQAADSGSSVDSSGLTADVTSDVDIKNITSMPIMFPSGELDEIPVNMSQDSGLVLKSENSLKWETEGVDQLDMLRRAMDNLKDATGGSEGNEDPPHGGEDPPTNNPNEGCTESNHEAILENLFSADSQESLEASDL